MLGVMWSQKFSHGQHWVLLLVRQQPPSRSRTALPPPGTWWECPRGVMVTAQDCGIVASEFVLQSRYYVHFRANTLGKGINPLILPAMG